MLRRCWLLGLCVHFAIASAVGAEPLALFNGRDLSGWDGDPRVWSVEKGAIVGRTTAESPIKQNTFLIWRGGEPADFRLALQYRIEGGNSGVQYRAKVRDPEKWIVGGYQADIDSGPTYTGILYEELGRGIVTPRGERVMFDADGEKSTATFAESAALQKHVRTDDWNDYVIEARGDRLRHWINGRLMSETIDGERDKRADKGVVAFQVHAGPPMTVQFRNVMLETLDADSPEYEPTP